jgi:hypothetical protein
MAIPGETEAGAERRELSVRSCRCAAIAGVGGALLMQGALLLAALVLIADGLAETSTLAFLAALAALGIAVMLAGKRLARRPAAERAARETMPIRLVAERESDQRRSAA